MLAFIRSRFFENRIIPTCKICLIDPTVLKKLCNLSIEVTEQSVSKLNCHRYNVDLTCPLLALMAQLAIKQVLKIPGGS